MGSQPMTDDERARAIEELARHGWSVHHENSKGYLQMRCGCGRHLGWLHKTPSNRSHYRQKVAFLIRECSQSSPEVP